VWRAADARNAFRGILVAETKFTPGGTSVTKFSVATNRRWKDQQSGDWKEEVNYTNVVLWKQEKVGEYLLKGKQVYVEGRLQTRSYDDKDGKKVYATEVVADEVILLGSGESQGAGSANGQARAASAGGTSKGKASSAAVADEEYGGVTDDDIPF
jgi:single-strand DNA-binding protein